MRGFGAVLSFEVADADIADAVCANVGIVTHATKQAGTASGE